MKKLMIGTDALKPALKKLSHAIGNNKVLPALSNLFVKARKNEVELIASDLELTMHVVIACECKDEFEMLIPFDFLKEVIGHCGSQPLQLQWLSSKKGQIVGENDVYKLNSLEDTTSYPKLPEIPEENMLVLDKVFMGWLGAAMPAVSKDELRPAMTKACLDFTDQGVEIVATDAHTLFKHFFPVMCESKEQLLISPKISKAMEGFEETKLFWHKNHIAFKANNITLISTRHESKYPDYRVVIPVHEANLPINRNELISALQRVCLANNEQFNLSLRSVESDLVLLSADNLGMDRRVEVRIKGSYTGKVETIVLNPIKLLMLLHQIEFETIYLHIDDPLRAVLISSEQDPDYLAMIMPLSKS